MSDKANTRERDTRPPEFFKLKQRVIEEVAIKQIVENISEYGEMRFPTSWMMEVDGMRNHLLKLVEEEVEKEERDRGRVAR